jgi:hypothetical protein
MATRRRWLQFSLRGLIALLTVFAIWLGVVVNRAREQREAVKAIESLGGVVLYDWQIEFYYTDRFNERPLLGDDFFHDAEFVQLLPESDVYKAIPYLKRLRGLRKLVVHPSLPAKAESELTAALPSCKVMFEPLDQLSD